VAGGRSADRWIRICRHGKGGKSEKRAGEKSKASRQTTPLEQTRPKGVVSSTTITEGEWKWENEAGGCVFKVSNGAAWREKKKKKKEERREEEQTTQPFSKNFLPF
jgi:hypothetical protein